ncbi:MAG TPA: di-heme oxidoredictase family protein [Gemmatimonadales bacterium]
MRPDAQKYIALTLFAVLSITGCENPPDAVTNTGSTDTLVAADQFGAEVRAAVNFGDPLPGLSAGELDRFLGGLGEFQEEETIEDGLGPVFNEASCALCHTNPVGGTNGRAETRFGRVGRDNVFDPLASLGGSLLQDHGIGAVGGDPPTHSFSPEIVPGRANVQTLRLTTPLFGLGLVDAVPDEAFLRLARIERSRSARTAGRAHMVTEIRTGQLRVGRFGWKAQVPTLFQFSGDAYLNEMGITNPEFPVENCPNGDCAALAFNPLPSLNDDGEAVQAFDDFMTLLAPPPRGPITRLVSQGSDIFVQIGCADCHTTTLRTGDSPVEALSNKVFHPYSDFLLHDMGRLGDGIVQGDAKGREFRTAPLWGVRTRTLLLHDGRATTISGAIAAHGGQGRFARELYARLSFGSRAALVAFVKSL